MIAGYHEFANDVQQIFGDIIGRYAYRLTASEFDSVELANDATELMFCINDDVMTMYIKSGDTYYNVREIAAMADAQAVATWQQRLEAACAGLQRDAYYKTWIRFYHELAAQYLGDAFGSGQIPRQQEYDQWKAAEEARQEQFTRAWNAVQQLAYEHPIRQKYIHNDASWLTDMLALLDG
jgi:hypothetical protein